MKQTTLILSLLLGVLPLDPAAAQSTDGVSFGVPDPQVVSLHAKVDELFRRGEVSRAYFIYRNELAPLGDKYAQYMVGYMHLTGHAVNQDKVVASAWYRLAAERGTPEFVQLRDQLLVELSEDDRDQSDRIYRELRREYNDLAVLLASIKRQERALRARSTGRASATQVSTSAFSPTPRGPEGDRYFRRLERNLEQQLRMLARLGDFPDLETNPDKMDLAEIERRVTARIEESRD